MRLPKIFLSYSTLDKNLAGSLKDCFNEFGFNVFLAHSTLVVSNAWRSRIRRQLKQRQVFVVLLTPNAKTSDWVDQEIGIAVALGKTIIPLQSPTAAYGFISEVHAISVGAGDPWEQIPSVLKGIAYRKSKIWKRLRERALQRLRGATSFHEARCYLRILRDFHPVPSRNERRLIWEAHNINDQIGGFTETNNYIAELGREFGKQAGAK